MAADLLSSDPHGEKSPAARMAKPGTLVIKNGVLALLVAQMVVLILLIRSSRTSSKLDDMYFASTAVFLMECTKLIICLGVVWWREGQKMGKTWEFLICNIVNQPTEILKLSVPSILYVIQNNLLYIALTNLDSATYQVCYQVKILTTALFSVAMLGRRLSLQKWSALGVLTIGVMLAQLSNVSDSTSSNPKTEQNKAKGLVAVFLAACTSGFAGVYFEKILKGGKATLWVRNIQMGIPSIFVAILGVYAKDGANIYAQGFFFGYNIKVILVIIIQGIGGLIVAVVVKYADNIVKVFAASFSIVVGSILSIFFFSFKPNLTFVSGAVCVCLSIFLYSRPERKSALLPTSR